MTTLGFEHFELAAPDPAPLRAMLLDLGFARTKRHATRSLDLYEQGDARVVVNADPRSFGARFADLHGPCIPSMAWRVADGSAALRSAVTRGAFAADGDLPAPAVRGLGDSLIYLVEDRYALGFQPHPSPDRVASKGLRAVDHLTNNVEKGTMGRWADFYRTVFGFTDVRSFEIRGERTGLTSYALRSPCGTFCIPINEADEAKSQINEYLAEYAGPGIQHVAFATDDLVTTMDRLEGARSIGFLDVEPSYYDEAFARVPHVREDKRKIVCHNVLVDGDELGYLLQIFTKNLVGPIFFELIQRENYLSFGEGNFGALFRSIERDQQRRGVFDG